MAKKLIAILLALLSVTSTSVPIYAKEANTSKSQIIEVTDKLEKLRSLSEGKLKFQQKDGQVFFAGKLSKKSVPGNEAAIQFLEDNKQLFGIDDVKSELQIVDLRKDSKGDTFIRFNQVINGISVKDKQLNIHFDKNGTIVSVNGKIEKDKSIEKLGSNNLTESDAVRIATQKYKDMSLSRQPQATRMILTKDNKKYEVFKVNIYYTSPARGNWDVYVEASSGEIIKVENKIKFDGQTVGTGTDVLGRTRPLNLYLRSGNYEMSDLSSPATDYIKTYSANNTISNGTLVTSNTNTFNLESHKASVSAHYNAGKVVDFYKSLFNRNSLDDKGMPIVSYTHFGSAYNNAFWDSGEMVYGDGDGTNFTYLSGDLDVVGHEMTHGVIENTANLVYENQPGAMNESIADVFGVLIETYNKYNVSSGGSWQFNSSDWVVGDEIYTPSISGDALRSLANPVLYGQPDNMSGYRYLPNDENGDYGGVHTNSGIPNKAAYLIKIDPIK